MPTSSTTSDNQSSVASKISYADKYIYRIPRKAASKKLSPIGDSAPQSKLLKTLDATRIQATFLSGVKRTEVAITMPLIFENLCNLRFYFGMDLTNAIERHSRVVTCFQECRDKLDHLVRQRAKLADHIRAIKATTIKRSSSVDADAKRLNGSLYDLFNDFLGDGQAEEGNEEEGEEATGPEEGRETRAPSDAGKELETIHEKVDRVDDDTTTRSEKSTVSTVHTEDFRSVSQRMSDTLSTKGSSQFSRKSTEVPQKRNTVISSETFSRLSATELDAMEGNLQNQVNETIRQLASIAYSVSNSFNNILRLYFENPSAQKGVDVFHLHRGGTCHKLLRLMRELGGVIKARLLITPEEEKRNMEYLESILKRETNSVKYIEMLENELKEAKKAMEQEFLKKSKIIENIKMDINQIEAFSSETVRRTLGIAEKTEFTCCKNSEQRTKLVNIDIKALEDRLNDYCSQNREEESRLRQEKHKFEFEIESWVKRYDTDMNDKMDEFQRLEITYEDERKLLSEMEDRFAELEAEYNNLMQERLVARKRQEWAERDKKAVIKHITVIQSFWRGYIVRKNIKKDEKRRIKEEKRKEKELKEQERKAKVAAGKE